MEKEKEYWKDLVGIADEVVTIDLEDIKKNIHISQ